ncbi:short-chain dehydrogenase reductase sdr protein [Purpureocillium lavendulum]|uniref:Thymocyte nuclear protein 1 n=1 Tax=Purpureocillium lavendulum TaxID=1247861 RepID=A0AB34FUF9_9HYPO|nr:short-chain dehydrogenase reductase sdr protein [Purpureocillium lavendulum]
MPAQKRASEAASPAPKRRSTRQAAVAAAASSTAREPPSKSSDTKSQPKAKAKSKPVKQPEAEPPATPRSGKPKASKPVPKPATNGAPSRAASEDPDPESIPVTNPEAPRHEGEWYWLMKAEPETRLENGIDVRFSIDDLRAKTKPEGWDGIRAYAARNHMRNMNAGDKAFFYHSNCKEPGIAGTMEIVREFSEDKSARRPGTPYYDASSTRENPRWSLVHVEFRSKLAVPITLRELRELGKPGGPLENMQMLKQSRLSVSRVSKEEWDALCKVADDKAKEAGLEHETQK